MAWVTPKTDWATTDGIATTDLNRIEGNIDDVHTSLGNYQVRGLGGSGSISSNILTISPSNGNLFVVTLSWAAGDINGISNTGWQYGDIIYLMIDSDSPLYGEPWRSLKHNASVPGPNSALYNCNAADVAVTNNVMLIAYIFTDSWVQIGPGQRYVTPSP